jgi:hypothetical protein
MDERGEDDGDGQVQGAGCYKAFYRNGNKLLLPAPSFMKKAATQASMRFNVVLIEEWTHIDAGSTGIDDQLLGRCTRPCWNQHHPVWGNHILLTAPAKTRMHPAARRYGAFERRVKSGDPTTATISYCYKDASEKYCEALGKTFIDHIRNDQVITLKKDQTNKAEWVGEGLGIWKRSGLGWFNEAALLQCVENGWNRGVRPMAGRG